MTQSHHRGQSQEGKDLKAISIEQQGWKREPLNQRGMGLLLEVKGGAELFCRRDAQLKYSDQTISQQGRRKLSPPCL